MKNIWKYTLEIKSSKNASVIAKCWNQFRTHLSVIRCRRRGNDLLSSKPKQTTNSFGSCNFQYTQWTINCLMLSILVLSSVLSKWYCIIHHTQSPLISVPIVGYVQSKSRARHMMTRWIPDTEWVPVPGGLADHPYFLLYMVLAENTAGPGFNLSVLGKLGLKNVGRWAATENCKVLCQPFHPLPHHDRKLQGTLPTLSSTALRKTYLSQRTGTWTNHSIVIFAWWSQTLSRKLFKFKKALHICRIQVPNMNSVCF